MDPSVLTAMISALIGGAAGEAGRGAWTSLTTLVRDRFGGGSAELATVEETTAADAAATAGVLVDRAQADPEFGRALGSWTEQTARLVQQSQSVVNTVSGGAQIHGSVIQAGNVYGSINLGGPR
ncbi:hypothetical protein [Rhizohabitans arisaemae]|uniref:hypothetical protein n=1 Tax=Rhizohabitans arisaemae TaxID=2720610 RepID=UPI0024B11FC3|nr:hypothetical protein [Rhizohabitans arisaemae]